MKITQGEAHLKGLEGKDGSSPGSWLFVKDNIMLNEYKKKDEEYIYQAPTLLLKYFPSTHHF